MTIDEKIAKEKANAEKLRKIIETGYDGEISIEALFCDDASAIKEAYERFENCAKEHEQLAEWLEELKMYKSLSPRELVSAKQKNDRVIEYSKGFDFGYKTAYSKAIDDFAEKIAIYGTYDDWGNVVDVLEIAEKLKKECAE